MESTQESTQPIKISLKPEEFSGEVRNGIGIVAPFDFALDDEYVHWLPDNVAIFFTRTPAIENTAVTVNLAQEVSSEVAVNPAVSSLLAVQPAAIGYACTSGSFVGGVEGEKHLHDVMINAGAPKAVTTSGALAMALEHLGVKNVAIATPYNKDLTDLLDGFLGQAGFTVVSSGYLDMEENIARINTGAVQRMARLIDKPDADAIFFSCTNLHTFEVIEALEKELGKPVLSANQVTVWACLKLGNLPMPHLNQKLFTT
jgi:maleate isomerase